MTSDTSRKSLYIEIQVDSYGPWDLLEGSGCIVHYQMSQALLLQSLTCIVDKAKVYVNTYLKL